MNWQMIVELLFMVAHLVGIYVHTLYTGKKVQSVCEKCFSPKVQGEQHDCKGLTDEQLQAVVVLIEKLRGE